MPRTSVYIVAQFCFMASVAAAHDLEASVTLSAPAVIVRAVYGGSDPVPFAKVQVFAPGNSEEYQTGVTDRRGYFSFVPEGGGAWKVVVDDEEGHRREVVVEVPRELPQGAVAAGGGSSRVERALLGLAMIFGLTGFWYGYKARRSGVERT
jgi:nickel transport protein